MNIFKKLLSAFLAAALTVSAASMTAAAESENAPAEEMIEIEEVKEAEVSGFFDSAVDLEPMSTVTKKSYDTVDGAIYYRIKIPTFGAVQFRADSASNVAYYGIMNPETDYVVSNRQTYSFLYKNYYLNPGTYYLRIWQGSGYISYKNLFYKFTPISSPKVTSVYPGNGSAHLSWEAVDGATKYAIYTYANGKYTHYRNTTLTNYTVKGLNNGTKYGFLVKAYMGNVWTPYTSADLVYTTPVAKPVVTAYAGNGKVRLNWGKIDGATKYAIYTYVNGKYSLYKATTLNYYNVTGLTNGTEYGFLVKAYVNGKWTAYNAYDRAYATPIDKPVISKTVAANGRVRLYWNKVDGAEKYAIYTYSNGKYTHYKNTKLTSYTVSGLTNGTKYGFLIRAYVNGAWTTYNVYDRVSATPKA